jgi:hypothetical protein
MGIITKRLNLKETLSVFGYAILAGLTTIMVLQPELYTPSTIPKPENISPPSIVKPSVLV